MSIKIFSKRRPATPELLLFLKSPSLGYHLTQYQALQFFERYIAHHQLYHTDTSSIVLNPPLKRLFNLTVDTVDVLQFALYIGHHLDPLTIAASRQTRLHRLREQQAARLIQKNCHPWLYKPVTRDGQHGILCRLGMRSVDVVLSDLNTQIHAFVTDTAASTAGLEARALTLL